MPTKIGNVTQRRYDQLVAESREAVELKTVSQFRVGDAALEIEPLRGHGGHSSPGDEVMGVSETLGWFAEDIGLSPATVKDYRWVSARWPDKKIRRHHRGVAFTVFRILGLDSRSERAGPADRGPTAQRPHRRAPLDPGRGETGGGLDGRHPGNTPGQDQQGSRPGRR
nr:hypothetical protein [Actinosynnema sp. ALI-1.44]